MSPRWMTRKELQWQVKREGGVIDVNKTIRVPNEGVSRSNAQIVLSNFRYPNEETAIDQVGNVAARAVPYKHASNDRHRK